MSEFDDAAERVRFGDDAMEAAQSLVERLTDEEVIDGIRLLGRTEGIFTETAGGVTVSVTKKLMEQGRFKREDTVVIAITGNGLKTQEVVVGQLGQTVGIQPNLASLDAALKTEQLLAGAR